MFSDTHVRVHVAVMYAINDAVLLDVLNYQSALNVLYFIKGLAYLVLLLKATLIARTTLLIKYLVKSAGLYFLHKIMDIFTIPKPKDH